MNAQVIGHRSSGNGRKEKDAMRGDTTVSRCRAGSSSWVMAVMLLVCAVLAGAPAPAWAQFVSGSSGRHGVFPPTPSGGSIPAGWNALVWNVRTGKVVYCGSYTPATGLDVCDNGSSPNTTAQIADFDPGEFLTTGVYEFESFNIVAPVGNHRSIYVVGTSPNTPLTILTQTDFNIAGNAQGYFVNLYVRGWDGKVPSSNAASLSVPGGIGGPGGFDGGTSGNGGITPSDGAPGFGPAGGAAGHVSATNTDLIAQSAQGTALNPSLSPLTGGSGGGGGAGISSPVPASCGQPNYAGGSGGGGGGGILIAATGKITIGNNSIVDARGGQGGSTPNACGYGGGGAGGNVRMVASLIEGTGQIVVIGGVRGNGTQTAAGGYVRFEASSNTYSGLITGAVGGSFVSFPTAPLPLNQPQLHISSIEGNAAPAAPSGSLSNPDITFATALTAPVTLTVNANNVPLGTVVNIRVAPALGEPTTATSAPLGGSFASSTATALVTLPPGAGLISATATFNVGGGGGGGGGAALGVRFDGELAQRMEVQTQPDGTSKTFLIARSGARFEIGARQ